VSKVVQQSLLFYFIDRGVIEYIIVSIGVVVKYIIVSFSIFAYHLSLHKSMLILFIINELIVHNNSMIK
jgi:hypothetical protein